MARLKPYGVYGIWNTRNGTLYIGSTTHPFAVRWSQHRADLRGYNYGGNRLLRADWTTFGPEAFQFLIIEIVADRHRVRERERFWLAWFRQHRSYNVVKVISR